MEMTSSLVQEWQHDRRRKTLESYKLLHNTAVAKKEDRLLTARWLGISLDHR